MPAAIGRVRATGRTWSALGVFTGVALVLGVVSLGWLVVVPALALVAWLWTRMARVSLLAAGFIGAGATLITLTFIYYLATPCSRRVPVEAACSVPYGGWARIGVWLVVLAVVLAGVRLAWRKLVRARS